MTRSAESRITRGHRGIPSASRRFSFEGSERGLRSFQAGAGHPRPPNALVASLGQRCRRHLLPTVGSSCNEDDALEMRLQSGSCFSPRARSINPGARDVARGSIWLEPDEAAGTAWQEATLGSFLQQHTKGAAMRTPVTWLNRNPLGQT